MSLYTKVKLYLEANSKTWDDTKVSLQDDGSGSYIKVWDYDLVKPTDEQLETYNSAATTEENNAVIKATRKKLYKSWDFQLEEIYDNGIDSWKARIKSIKDANPTE